MNTATTMTAAESKKRLEITKLVKSKATRLELATSVVEITSKLMHQISESNRYYDMLKQRDKTIENLRLDLAAFRASDASNPRKALMLQAQRLAVETGAQTRVANDQVEIYNNGSWEKANG